MEVKSKMSIKDDNILGRILKYKSEITGAETEFKVAKCYSIIQVISNQIFSVGMIVSENGTHYNLEKDKILWK